MKPVLLLVGTLITLTAQVRVPANRLPPPASQTGEGSIEGSVVDAVTREPVKKASVNLNGSISLNAVTDASGRFAFRKLPAGPYMIQAQSERHPPRPNGVEIDRQVTVTLAAGEQKRDVKLLLTSGGSLRGRIVDEEGSPMPQCQVNTMQFRDTGAGRTLSGSGSSQSDANGEYRFSNVPAGKYYVSARCWQSIPLPHALMPRNSFDKPTLIYPPRFYPGAPGVSGAVRMEVLPGADVAGIDFQMAPATAVGVRGRAGPLPLDGNLQIRLEPKESLLRGLQQGARVNPSTGHFEIPNVQPGSYHLLATRSSAGGAQFAKVPLEIGSAPPEPVDLILSPVPAITGSISIEGEARGPADPMRVSMHPLDGQAVGPPPEAEVTSDGTFTLNSVLPGRWRLHVNYAPGYVKSVTQGDREITPDNLDIGASTDPLKIVIGTKMARLEGMVSAGIARGTEVFAVVWAKARPDFQQTQPLRAQGRPTFALPPGRYYACLVAVAQPWTLFQNRALLAAMQSRCEAVDVSEAGSATVPMPLITTEDLKRLLEKLDE